MKCVCARARARARALSLLVGFGDIVPVTPVGRATIVAAIFTGTGILPYQLCKV